jgi:hypothetical protein
VAFGGDGRRWAATSTCARRQLQASSAAKQRNNTSTAWRALSRCSCTVAGAGDESQAPGSPVLRRLSGDPPPHGVGLALGAPGLGWARHGGCLVPPHVRAAYAARAGSGATDDEGSQSANRREQVCSRLSKAAGRSFFACVRDRDKACDLAGGPAVRKSAHTASTNASTCPREQISRVNGQLGARLPNSHL